MSTTSEIVFQLNFMAGAADEGFGSKYSDAKIFRAAAARLDELERENARLRAALMYSHGAIDFYEKVQAASQDEKIAVGQDHWDWLIEAARRARAALAGSEKP